MGVYDRLSQLSREQSVSKTVKPEEKKTVVLVSRDHDTVIPRHHDTIPPADEDPIINAIRLAVRQLGKEAATHRFTTAEKQAVAEIIFAYRAQNIRTSENEIARIAINFIVNDHAQKGAESVLHRSLKALHQ